MNEDLKIDVYQRIVNNVDCFEKEDVKRTACVLYAKKFANCMREIYFYSSDFMGTGEESFQLDYNIEYSNGDFQHGDCEVDTNKVISAFGFANYEELKTYLTGKYSDDEKAWKKIVEEMKEKNLSPSVDENEGGNNFMTNIR